jgi:large subunit ribosomal protein L10
VVQRAKIEKVEVLQDKFTRVKAAVLLDFRGIDVPKITEIRKQLRDSSLEYIVVKNTLARIASNGTQFEAITHLFQGPTSIAFSYQDALAPAKVISSLTKKESNLVIKGGIIEGKALDPGEVNALAEIPPREILLSQLLGSLKTPLAHLVQTLHGIIGNFLSVLKAIEEKKGPASKK